MSSTLEQLASEALRLPSELRAELADILVGSLDVLPSDAIQEDWTREALRRRDEIRSGKVQSVDGEQVMAEARRLVGR